MTESSESTPTVSDAELLQRHLAGDEQAFTTLVERYRRELFNFLARFTGDRALADDVFQEAFLQLHISAGSFDTSRRLKPWLFTIAANKARDAMRSRSRRQATPLDAPIDGDKEDTYANLMPTDIPSPEESIANLETRQAVRTIVEDMPENLRVVLLLSYFHDFAYKEIAEILSVPLGTVKSRLHAAVKHFARRWKSTAERSGHDTSAD
ncbi:MAG: RNA polymerase sigma factor [Pirellulaceae bacterium]